MTAALHDYIKAFTHLRKASTNGGAPHKPILLLRVRGSVVGWSPQKSRSLGTNERKTIAWAGRVGLDGNNGVHAVKCYFCMNSL